MPKKTPEQKAFDQVWYSEYHPCIICGNPYTITMHHRVPACHFVKNGEYQDSIKLYTGDVVVMNSWRNTCPLCRDHHEEFHLVFGQCWGISAGKRENRVRNAQEWFRRYPPTQYRDSKDALPAYVWEEMLDEKGVA